MSILLVAVFFDVAPARSGCSCSDDNYTRGPGGDAAADKDADDGNSVDTATAQENDAEALSTEWDGPGEGLCEGGIDIASLETGESIGIEQCPTAGLHRYAAAACGPIPEIETADGCDCAEDEVCVYGYSGAIYCKRPCESDADCGSGEACLCPFHSEISVSNGYPHCVPAECSTDADCGAFRCGLTVDICGTADGLKCHTADDACEGARQCSGDLCTNQDGDWICSTIQACD